VGKASGFIEFNREAPRRRSTNDRIKDWREFYESWTDGQARNQGARCMNCALPFCHKGCPLGNLIPDWNDLVYKGRWKEAIESLQSTNNFPEFTGRICPAPCEVSCVLAINQEPVAIEHIEKVVADKAFDEGWIRPEPPYQRTGKRVAIVGSGPAGLAAAQQLNRAGHWVTVFERDETIGGLLALGIPNFKLEKHLVERRVAIMAAEGVEFKTNAHVGVNYPTSDLKRDFDAICIAGGSTLPRTLDIPGSDLVGVHLAMEYLTQQNRVDAGQIIPSHERITANGKQVIIIGGGDTGSDCLGTARRQGADTIYQLEILPEPPHSRGPGNPWPQWSIILRTSHAHEEGSIREFGVLTKSFFGSGGRLSKLQGIRLDWGPPDVMGRSVMQEIAGSEFEIDTQLVLLAMGFVCPDPRGMIADLEVQLDARGNVETSGNKMTTIPGIFAAGDMSRGQSLVVWAIAEGRQAAFGIDQYLMGSSNLPTVDLKGWA